MSFLDVQSNIENAKVIIQPIPFEKTTSYIKGTKKGPEEIIKASKELETYDIETDSEPYLVGIHTLNPTKIDKIKNHNKFTISLGGEHTITYHILKSINQENLSILHIDAHADLKNEFDKNKFSHACVARRIHEINKNLTLVGIRAIDKEEKDFIEENNIPTFSVEDASIRTNEIIQTLSDNVYISIDLDAFDPSILPSVGNPEPAGFQWNQLLIFLKHIFESRNVIACDIVELSPKKNDLISPYLAAKLAYKLIAYKF